MIFGESEELKTYKDLMKVLNKSLPKVKFAWIPVVINSIHSKENDGKWIWFDRYIECKHLISVWNIAKDPDSPKHNWKDLGCKINAFRFATHNLEYNHFVHPFPENILKNFYYEVLEEVITLEQHTKLLTAIEIVRREIKKLERK